MTPELIELASKLASTGGTVAVLLVVLYVILQQANARELRYAAAFDKMNERHQVTAEKTTNALTLITEKIESLHEDVRRDRAYCPPNTNGRHHV